MARAGLVGFALVVGCARGTAPAPVATGLVVTEIVSLSPDRQAALSACDDTDQQRCHVLAVGDPVDQRRLVVGTDTVVTLRAGEDVTLVTSPSTVLADLAARRLTVERGAVSVETASGASEPVAVAAAGHVVRLDRGRAAKVVVAANDGAATVTVHRGAAALRSGGDERRLARGQTAELEDERVSIAYVAPEAAPAITPPRSERRALRGLGRMTARVPGREDVVSGVRLASHEVRVVVSDGIAKTTVEEVFENETPQVLEGRFVFPVPPEATISRLALWVGGNLVEGEMVESKRAASIFKGIVDDTVRPRDPALLEWAQGSEVSLKIFPIPARGSRRVLLSYEEPVLDLAGRGRYVYPLSAGEDRATVVGRFSLSLHLEDPEAFDVEAPHVSAALAHERDATTVSFTEQAFVPERDFVVTWQRPQNARAEAWVEPVSGGDETAFVVRALVASPKETPPPAGTEARVFVLDKSRSQSRATLAAQASLVLAALRLMDGDQRFALLACDAACEAYPADHLASASDATNAAAAAWMARLEPSGASDLAGALAAGLSRLPDVDGAQLVALTDGSPSAGEIRGASIAARVRRARRASADVRLLGIGRTVDEVVLRGLAHDLAATYERLDHGASSGRRIEEIVLGLAQPVVRDLTIDLPGDLRLASPLATAVRLGSELRIAGRGAIPAGAVKVSVRGKLGGAPYEQALEVRTRESRDGLASRAFAQARIDALTRSGDPRDEAEIVELSKRFFVMSRKTSLLVLENDEMFRAFGIERTRGAKGPRPPAPPVATLDPGAPGAPLAPWSAGADAVSAPVTMWGDAIGDAFGSGGLGLSGIGEGGGGRGEGIGLGLIGTLGAGAGSGRFGGEHRAAPPSVRLGSTSVSGRLPPEVIQRVVRQNFGRLRLCYEQLLRREPEAAGRVSVRFVIGPDGGVAGIAASGTISNSPFLSCVESAFRGLSFPSPEAGSVSVVFPVNFTPEGAAPPSSGGPSRALDLARIEPRVTHVLGTDAWMRTGEDRLARLTDKLTKNAATRSAHAALIRGLLASGRFTEALERARAFSELDPDSPAALDLVAQASAAAGQRVVALQALGGLAELSPRSVAVQRRVALAFEAAGDERRACAHWRAAADLEPAIGSRVEAWRCRARALGESERVLAEMRAEPMTSKSRPFDQLLARLEKGEAPAHERTATWSDLEVAVTCDAVDRSDGACPSVVTVTGAGDVVSPIIPTEQGKAWASPASGLVRTVLVGGHDRARVRVKVAYRGTSREVALERSERATATETRATSL